MSGFDWKPHAGTKEDIAQRERGERLRQAGFKAGNASLPHSEAIKSAREEFLKRQEESKKLRAMGKKNKGSAIKKALDKHK